MRTLWSLSDQRCPITRSPSKRRLIAGLPVFQQVGQHRVQLLFRRVPGLVQVVVDAGRVDGPDGRFGVGIGGQQHPPRVGINFPRPLQKLDAASCPACAGRSGSGPPAPAAPSVGPAYPARPGRWLRASPGSRRHIAGADPAPPPPERLRRHLPPAESASPYNPSLRTCIPQWGQIRPFGL